MTARLYKKEKLCGDIAIATLFDSGDDQNHSALAYPVKIIWRQNTRRHNDADIRFLISVPKRRLRHAVDRVKIRRRIREAYRLNRPCSPIATDAVHPSRHLDIALIYVAPRLEPFAKINRAIRRLLSQLPSPVTDNPTPATDR